MSDEVRINIQVGDVKHPLIIERDEEPVARRAARLLTSRYEEYAREFRAASLPKDYLLAMAGLDIAMRYVRLSQDNDTAAARRDVESLINDIKTFINVES